MIMKNFISSVIGEYGVDLLYSVLDKPIDYDNIQESWNEEHRFYHGMDHLKQLINLIESGISDEEYRKKLYLIAIFHDVVYDPYSQDNEEKSAEMYRVMTGNNFDQEVYDAILDSKDHTKKASNLISEVFLDMDIHNLLYGSLDDMIRDSHLLTREYGAYDWTLMKAGRISFMEKFAPHILGINPESKVNEYISWLRTYEPKIAVFAGTFYPFHKGHLDILRKAEKIFDKVIVACGNNPLKSEDPEREEYLKMLSKKLPNNQVESFDVFLTDYIATKNYSVTIIKGLRNPSDFDSEKLQLRYMEDMNPNIKIAYIISDRKYEHLSSSGIKTIDFIGSKKDGERDLTSKYLL
jgi:pantetheine-phosphate adenylyltransferase